MDRQLEWLSAQQQKAKIEDIRLTQTRAFVSMLREARALKHPQEILNELYLLVCAMAKKEWGDDTLIDDFSVPDKFVVRSGKREEVL